VGGVARGERWPAAGMTELGKMVIVGPGRLLTINLPVVSRARPLGRCNSVLDPLMKVTPAAAPLAVLAWGRMLIALPAESATNMRSLATSSRIAPMAKPKLMMRTG